MWFILIVTVVATQQDVDLSIHTSNSSQYHVYVVNLARRSDRLARLKKELPTEWAERCTFTTNWKGPLDGRNLTWTSLVDAGVNVYAGWELR